MNITTVDKNLAVKTSFEEPDIKFYDIKENTFCLFGLSVHDDYFRRIPESLAKQTNEGVLYLHTNTSGGKLRFITDSPYVAISAKMPDIRLFPHMPQSGISGFDLYVGDKFFAPFMPPAELEGGYDSINHFKTSELREITIHFPLYNNVSDLYIGLKEGSAFLPPKDFRNNKTVLFYGSSITQGGCVSRPGLSFPAIAATRLDFNLINLGFSGSAKGEECMAEYIGDLHPDIFVLDYDHNAPTLEHLNATHEKFFKIFREKNPDTPVIMISSPDFVHFEKLNAIERREVIRTTYNNAVLSGDKNVYFIDGETLWGEDWDLCTMDKSHPNDLGHYRMAMNLIPVLEKILNK